MTAVAPMEGFALASLTTLGVGGPARFFVDATDETTLLAALEWASDRGLGVRVLGGGSNVVVSDAGFDGLVVRVSLRGIEHREQAGSVELSAGAGEPWDALVELAVERGWAGVECLSGIPGYVGATPIQNVGAYGQDVSETITSVRVYDRVRGRTLSLSRQDCGFSYRDSAFKRVEPDRWIVLGVTFRLLPGGAPRLAYPDLVRELERRHSARPTLREVRNAVLDVRRQKSMVLDPSDDNRRSCGSFFVNPVVSREAAERVALASNGVVPPQWPQPDGRIKLSAAWLIEHSGFWRGERSGAVGLSTRHALSLVCHEGARAADVAAFARVIRARVEQKFAVRLVPEPSFWGFAKLEEGLPDELLR